MEDVNHSIDARRNVRQQEKEFTDLFSNFMQPVVQYQNATIRLWSGMFETCARWCNVLADQQQQASQQIGDQQQQR